MNKTILYIVIVVVVVFGGLALIYILNQDKDEGDTNSELHNVANTNAVSVANLNAAVVFESVVFTHDIFDVTKVSHITPLGELNGGYIESQSFAGVMVNIIRDANGDADLLDIFAPTDIQLVRYAYYDMGDGSGAEWALYFTIAPGITMTLNHVREAGDKIVSATTTVPREDSRTVEVGEPIVFEAGEYIGRTDGTSQAHNWNIYVYDDNTENHFAQQGRYTSNYLGEELLTATCAFDYYPESIRAPYEALYGYSAAGQSTTCGTVARDSVGSLAGLWYFSDNPSDGIAQEQDGVYATPFAAYTASDGTIILHEINGQRFDIRSDNASYKKPADITSEHCYALRSISNNSAIGFAFFKMVDEYSMQLVYSSTGSCPSSFPSSEARTYYR